jgi:hypothetical protein
MKQPGRSKPMPPKKATKKTKCYIDSCDRDAEIADLCKTCYNGMYYWKGASPKKIVKRAKQLQVLSDRMDMMGGNRK